MHSSYSSKTSTLPRYRSTIARCHEITRCGAIHGVSIKVCVDMASPRSLSRSVSHGSLLSLERRVAAGRMGADGPIRTDTAHVLSVPPPSIGLRRQGSDGSVVPEEGFEPS